MQRATGRRLGATLALLACLALAGCKVELYGGLDEVQANEMVALLREAGLSAERRQEKDKAVTVMVEDRHFADAVSILKANGYPRQIYATLGSVFSGGGLVSSPLEERAKMMYALSEELGRTISSIDGVLTARVHIVLAESDALNQQSKPSAASVFIRYAAYVAVGEYLPQIKLLVANAVAGVSYDKVSVVLMPVEVARPAPRSALMRLVDSEPSFPLTMVAVGGVVVLILGAVGGAVLRRHLAPKLKILQ